jgi:hypothetical protein
VEDTFGERQAWWRPVGQVRRPRLARQRVKCFPDHRDEPTSGPACRGTITLRQLHGRHRLIGRGTFRNPGRTFVGARVSLTALGARLSHRRRGVVVTATVTGQRFPAGVAWSYRLR